MDNEYIINSGKLSDSALRRKNELENDPSSRTDHMKYMEGQEQINRYSAKSPRANGQL